MAEDTTGAVLLRNLQGLPPKVLEGLAIALYEEATRILEASQPLVPVDTTNLRSTGIVQTEGTPAQDPVVRISYGESVNGSPGANYAAAVHEITGRNHPVGKDHYLSEPYFAATAGMEARLAETIRRHLGVP